MEVQREILMALGEKIRLTRHAQQLTQEEVGYRAGLSRSYYSGVERGTRNVSAINLIRIAFALDVEVGDLFPSKKLVSQFLTDLQN